MDLNAKQRNRVRSITRRAFVNCNGQCDATIELAATGLLAVINTVLNPVLIGDAMSLMVQLVLHWIARKTDTPYAVFVAGEPGATTDD